MRLGENDDMLESCLEDGERHETFGRSSGYLVAGTEAHQKLESIGMSDVKTARSEGERGNEHVPGLALDVGMRRNESMSARGGGGGGEASPAGLSPFGSFPCQQSRIHTGSTTIRKTRRGRRTSSRQVGWTTESEACEQRNRTKAEERKLGMKDNRSEGDAHRATTYVFILLRRSTISLFLCVQ